MSRDKKKIYQKSSKSVSSIQKKYFSTIKSEPNCFQRQDVFQEIDTALGLFFFGCNIPMNVVESTYFKNFVKSLLPAGSQYKTPTRKTLSTTILDRIHESITAERLSVHNSDGVLLIDGWKNSSANKQNVVCTIHTIGDKSLFLNSWDMTGVSETANELKKVIDEAKVLAKEKFNINIYAVVSDNASAMVSMGKKIDIWHTTCHSHSGNLLAKALVPKQFATNINKLLREFKTPGAENELKKRGGNRIILACDTRWCSYRDAFRCLLKNLPLMRALIDENIVKLDAEKNRMMNDPSFELHLQDYILIFDPICQLINVCQKSNTSLADACEEWLKLELPTDNGTFEEILGARMNKVLTPIVLAANLLHPQYRGKLFKDYDQLETAYDFVEQELTSKDYINDNTLSDLRILTESVEIHTGFNNDLRGSKLWLKKALDADCIGSKTKAIVFYGSSLQSISAIDKETLDPEEKEKLKQLKRSIETRVQKIQVILKELGLTAYRDNSDIFKRLTDQKFTSPTAFWTATRHHYSKFTLLAEKLLKIPSASAQLERLFSSWAFVHSDLRNRLTVKRSMKLVDIYYSLKMNEQFDEYYDNFAEDV